MRRSRVLTSLMAVVSLASTGVFLGGTSGVAADTASPEVEDEAWFARIVPSPPVVDVPCVPNEVKPLIPSTVPPQGCGDVSPTAIPTPQSKPTGHYVVASAGGKAGDEANTSGDTGWAAFSFDLSKYFGASVEKFEVKLTQGKDNNGRNNGDTWQAGDDPLPIQGCQILEFWSGGQGANPWDGRPTESAECVVPTVTGTTFTFDVTNFARAWVEGANYGFVIKPGTPEKTDELQPFQITFSGRYDAAATAVKPQVAFVYTPAPDDDLFGGLDEDFGGGGEDFFEDISAGGEGDILAAVPEIDVIPTDAGSEPLPEEAAAPTAEVEVASPPTRIPTRPISREVGFPWLVLLLLPLAALAFWGTGTALGPIGDPVPARRGGVSRVLAQRQAAQGSSDFETRN